MNNLRFLIYWSFSYLFIVSCSNHEPNKDDRIFSYKINIVADKVRYFNEGETGDVLFNRAVVSELDNSSLILAPDKQSHQILFFEASGGESFKTIQLELEGPNGVKQISNFQFENDTLYVVDSFAYALVLFDGKGKALKRIKLINPELPVAILPRYFSKSEMVIDNGTVFILGDADVNISDSKSKVKSKSLIEVDILSGKIKNHFDLPDILKKDLWMINQHFFTAARISDSSWVYSYDLSDSLYLYTLGDNSPKAFRAASLYHKPLKPWGKRDSNSTDAYRYYLNNTSYFMVLYDEYRQLIYRFVQHPNEKALSDGDINQMWVRDFTLMVLDMDFNILAERLFQSEVNVLRIPIVDEDGLWLAVSDSSTRKSEEITKFIQLDVKKKNEN